MKKEKRYFCDVVDKVIDNKFITYSFIILLLILTTFLHLNYNPDICNNTFDEHYKEIQEKYNLLISIGENTIIEGKAIDISTIPEDIYFNISSSNDAITYYYSIDTSSKYNMTYTLSKNLEILDKKSDFTLLEKEDYMKTFKISNYLTSFLYGFISLFAILLVGTIVVSIPYIISSCHKHSDDENL